MDKVILIHANCNKPGAKGDFAFAGNLAKDLVDTLSKENEGNLDVVLVSPRDGIPCFKSLYGEPVEGRICIEGRSVGLSSLEDWDAVENTVVAFIAANLCKYSPADIIRRLLSPESKFLLIANVNGTVFTRPDQKISYLRALEHIQPRLYGFFAMQDTLIGSAGFGQNRLGLPTITKTADLPPLSSSAKAKLPKAKYGFMYPSVLNAAKDYHLIKQYIQLSRQRKYILVGKFATKKSEIESNFKHLAMSQTLPPIEYHHSVPNRIMRQMIAQSSTLVLSTGVTSTLEAMQDKKLTFYQYDDRNAQFVTAYLMAVESISLSDDSLLGLAEMVSELSRLLFAAKPLSPDDMQRTDELLKQKPINAGLVRTNQIIIEQASGKIATRILDFLGSTRVTKDQRQLTTVCFTLRTNGEKQSPVLDEALRRAAGWGYLFELKVLIKAMQKEDLDKADPSFGDSALHWAVACKQFDCARVLIDAGISLNLQNNEGKTPLHLAIQINEKPMIKLLIEAGAALDLRDRQNHTPIDYARNNEDLLLFIDECCRQIQPELNNSQSHFCQIA